MSPLAVLLRVLLCLALILNGSVPVAYAAPVAAASQAPSGSDDETGGGCHGAAMTHDAPAEMPSPMPADSGDCCNDEGDCRSTCAQHCAVSIPVAALPDPTPLPAAGPLPMAVAWHSDPRLRDRIRPPIA